MNRYPAREANDVERLVAEHAPMVKRIAYHLIHRLPPNVQLDDLVQTGIVGLIEAAKHYNASQGASFETYAGIRVRGAMLDEVRRSDWAPRSVYRKSREIAAALRKVENRHGRAAKPGEVAAEMGVSLDEYHRLLREATSYQVFSFEESFGDGEHENDTDPHSREPLAAGPLDQLAGDAFKQALANTIAALPEREALVLSLYYDEELNLREIGEVLGVSESRVSQIHSQALMRLRVRMVDWRA